MSLFGLLLIILGAWALLIAGKFILELIAGVSLSAAFVRAFESSFIKPIARTGRQLLTGFVRFTGGKYGKLGWKWQVGITLGLVYLISATVFQSILQFVLLFTVPVIIIFVMLYMIKGTKS